MTIVEKLHSSAEIGTEYDNYARDTLTLTWEERRQGHGKRRSDAGIEFAISIPGGTVLKGGDHMVLRPERTIVKVQEAPEAVYIIRPKTPQEWAYYAYHVGNRHQQVMIGDTELIFLQNPAVRSLLEQLRVHFENDERPFTAALANVGHSHAADYRLLLSGGCIRLFRRIGDRGGRWFRP
jgi:urease accessory protein